MPGQCPICGGPLEVTRLECGACGTGLTGHFYPGRFGRLSREQQQFIEVFVVCRGNIKEVERVLGVSYPTVRGRLEQVIEALGYPVERREAGAGGAAANTARAGARASSEEPGRAEKRRKVLEALRRGEISTEEAIRQLREQRGER
ncbi:MAG TPA: DUF2089 domain-containing protein [Firmicutes bacterium]|nr:DUF2089 domain-containing protein [Bacillota bacterium]